MHILECKDAGELDELTFTVSSGHFGALQTIELEDGGTLKSVTMDNRSSYVYQICHWYLTGNTTFMCIHYTKVEMGRYRLQMYRCIMSIVSRYGDISLLKSIRSSSIYDY